MRGGEMEMCTSDVCSQAQVLGKSELQLSHDASLETVE
tara:strand:- start:31675 stop:31788 length:114 start_codon:yes stop_codon:yes gene_type:complete